MSSTNASIHWTAATPHRAHVVSPLVIVISATHSSLPLFQCCCQASCQSSTCSRSSRVPIRAVRISWWRRYRRCFLRHRALHGRSRRLRFRSPGPTFTVQDGRGGWIRASLLYWWRRGRCRLAIGFEICRRSPALLCTMLSFSEPPAFISLVQSLSHANMMRTYRYPLSA